MSKSFTLDQLTAGIKDRNLSSDERRLVEKWSRVGLLRGLENQKRNTMARLLENQAAQVLRESNGSSTGGGSVQGSGQIQGFSNIVFPMVRRIFGGLVANELISIQPMALPSGLIFYLDYTYGSNVGGDAGFGLSNSATQDTYSRGQSIYNNPTGKGVRSGSLGAGGMYDLVGAGYSRVHKAVSTPAWAVADVGAWTGAAEAWVTGGTVLSDSSFTGSNAKNAGYDSDVSVALSNGVLDVCFAHVAVANFTADATKMDTLAVDQISVFGFGSGNNGGATAWGEKYQSGKGVLNLRRHTKRGDWDGSVFTANPLAGTHYQFVLRLSNAGAAPSGSSGRVIDGSVVLGDGLEIDSGSGATLTVPSFETDFGSTPSPAIPEIDVKIESIAITAQTRKLRARWSPELAQDLNAYHAMDAEVELTQILSEQISLEIDREILNDLLTQANAANYYWSKAPGKFLDKYTGRPVQLASSLSVGPAFTGTVREWYETLVEVVIDVANTIHRKTLRGSANFVVTSPDVATLLEASVMYKPKYSLDGDGQVSNPITIGAEPIGTLSNRFTVYKDPYFPRNQVLVGFKGASQLESGYVYAPYVPVIVTPTIFGTEDFSPRKGVMTRYGKKMVRSDFYGRVTILDMNIR